jgi:hypothetical protein
MLEPIASNFRYFENTRLFKLIKTGNKLKQKLPNAKKHNDKN